MASTVVTLDENRIAHVGGNPFFLIGARHIPEGGTPEMLAEAGFNAYRWLGFGTESCEHCSDPPGTDQGLMFWAYVYDRAVLSRSDQHRLDLETLVNRVRDHPALLCYENYNEVAMRWKHTDRKAQPPELEEGTELLRSLDPDHPVWLAHDCGRTVETLREYNGCMDILGCNPYAVHPPGMRQHYGIRADGRLLDCPDQSVHAVGRYTEKMLKVGRSRKPVWMLIQAMANENWFDPERSQADAIDESMVLYPTYEQMRFMAYDAFISGATGLAFSMYKTPVDGQTWQDVKRLVGELKRLHDVLASPPIPATVEISYKDLGFTVWDGVGTLMRRKGDGVFLIAANRSFDPAEVAMRITGVPSGTAAVVESEAREVPIDNSVLHDSFEPYGVHIYKWGA